MESVSSSSAAPENRRRGHRQANPAQPIAERIVRAVRHRLRLLHRADSLFFVLGATGNVYTVGISAAPSCTCPDRAARCKHILFVFIRVLGLPLEDASLWRRTLRPCHLSRLLSRHTSGEALAGASLRETFHRIFSTDGAAGGSRRPETAGEGGACPVCLEDMGRGERVVGCGTCKNVIHEECFLAWKNSCRRRSATCVLCRARWRNGGGEKYLNLSEYVEEEDMVEADVGRCT